MAALEQPKKPAGGAYGRFMAEKRAEFTKQCAGQPVSAVSKLGGESWKKLDEKQKAPYQKLFEEAQKKYKEAMEAFLTAGGVKAKGVAALRSEKRKAKESKKAEDASEDEDEDEDVPKKKKAKASKDKDAPKKPVGGAYGQYLASNRERIVKSLPAGHKITDVTKAAGAQWKALSDAAKKPYEEQYKAKMSEYNVNLEAYKASKPLGA